MVGSSSFVVAAAAVSLATSGLALPARSHKGGVSSAQRERLAQSVGSAIGSVSTLYQQHKANKAAAQQQQQGTAEAPAAARRAIDDFEFEAREFQDGEMLVARAKSMTGKKIGSSAVSFKKSSTPKSSSSSSSKGHSSTLSKINTAINGAQVAVDAVNAGANVANAVNQPAPAARREFDDFELCVREPVKSKGGARKSSGGKHSSTLSKINTAINGAQVAVDAVNAGANVANAVNQPTARGLREERLVARAKSMTGKKIGSSAVSFNKHPKSSSPKSSGSSKGHSGILSKIDTAIKGAEVAVDAVNAGANVANAVNQPAPAPARREFDDFELYVREPVKSKGGARKSSGGKHSSTLSKINTAINGAQVAVDAVNAGANVANAANQPAPARRDFDDFELYAREPVKSKGGARKSSGGKHSSTLSKINTAINGAQVAVDAVNAGANVANAVNQPAPARRNFDDFELYVREPVKSKGGARKSSGGKHSSTLSKINTAIDGASVAVDAVNAGANVVSAVKQRRELDDYFELDAREWALLEELD